MTKICKLCGQPFEPRTNAQLYCTRDHFNTCVICGSKFKIDKDSKNRKTCSKKCEVELRERTMLKRYGVRVTSQSEELQAKVYETNLKKYGTKHPAQNEDVKRKASQHFKEKYGVEWPTEASWFSQKSHETCLRKYGVDNTAQISERIRKTKATNLQKYGSVAPMGNVEVAKKASFTRSNIFTDDRTHVDSEYERVVYNYCLNNDLNFQYQPVSIPYLCKNQQHNTLIDFRIEGTLVEVKGGHLLLGLWDEFHVPIECKINVYRENSVLVVTDSLANSVFNDSLKGINIEAFKRNVPWSLILDILNSSNFVD